MCLPKAAHCDGHPVPEPEETQVAGFPLALQVTSVVVRRQEPIATAAPLSRPFQAGEGCRGVGSCKRAACWARAREKGPVVARLTPPQSRRACARSSPADRGLLFQGSARGQAPAPAGGIKGCLAGLPQTPVCSTRGRWTPGRVSSRRPPARTCAQSAPLSPSRSLVKGLSVLETSAEGKFRRPGVESADDCVSIPREPCKEENLVYNRGKKYTACFSVQERKSLCFTRDGTLSKLSELTVVSSRDPSLRRKTKTKANYSLQEPSETFLQTN